MDPLAGSRWSEPGTVAGFTKATPNAVLLKFADEELQRSGSGYALDLGCGAGRNAVPIARLGWKVIGTDLSWPMLCAAASRMREARLDDRLRLVLAPMERIPARDRSFSLVIANGIWNLARSAAQFRQALGEAARVAKPGAGLFVFTFSRNTFPPEAESIPGEPFVFTQLSGDPQCFLTETQLIAELDSVGFAPDPGVPIREYSRPQAGDLCRGTKPVIWEAAFRRTGCFDVDADPRVLQEGTKSPGADRQGRPPRETSAAGMPRGALTPIALPLRSLVPPPDLFRHASNLHGQAHVARVLVHAFRLIAVTGWTEEAPRLWAAVYLHDIARTHDGWCHRHGGDAMVRFETLAEVRELFAQGGVAESDYASIRTAVVHHCLPNELDRAHPHWRLTSLLKDADGLDRVRLGDLDSRRLRNPEAREMVHFAQMLFDQTDGKIPVGRSHFEALWSEAGRLSGRAVGL